MADQEQPEQPQVEPEAIVDPPQDVVNETQQAPTPAPIDEYAQAGHEIMRIANEQSWEQTAKHLNRARSATDRLIGRDKWSAMDVAQDEAQKIDAHVESEMTPTHLSSWRWHVPAKSHSEAFERVAHDPNSLTNKFIPSTDRIQSWRNASDILRDQKQVRAKSNDIKQALQKGNVREAGAVYGEYLEDHKFSYYVDQQVALLQEIEPALSAIVSDVYEKQDRAGLVTVLESSLAPLIVHAGVAAPEEQRKTPEMQAVVIELATDAAAELIPQIWKNDGTKDIGIVLSQRVGLLETVGALSREEIASNSGFQAVAIRKVRDIMLDNILRGSELRLPYEGGTLVQLGLLDINAFVADPDVRQVAVLALAREDKDIQEKTEALLRKDILGEGYGEDDEAQGQNKSGDEELVVDQQG